MLKGDLEINQSFINLAYALDRDSRSDSYTCAGRQRGECLWDTRRGSSLCSERHRI